MGSSEKWNDVSEAEIAPDKAERYFEDGYLPTPWGDATEAIARFPNLRDAELWMGDECYHPHYDSGCDQNYMYRSDYQNLFFEALKDAKGVDFLTLKNVQDEILTETGSEADTEAVRCRLKRFHIMIVTDECSASPAGKADKEELQLCFNSLLKKHWLEPLQTQLTHLTVYCDTYWGVYPFTDIRTVHFPHLVSLALGNWTIAHDWQFDWISSHGETLQELILDDVCIVYAMMMPEKMVEENWPSMPRNLDPDESTSKQYFTRWNDVFSKFQKHLLKFEILLYWLRRLASTYVR